jgi:flavin reductase (DIM6/NTAB) family NADH-FMN oxidoreductase RutF
METPIVMTLDSEKLRAAMRAWSAGVTVVTAVYENNISGATVNSFTSISLEPALITISMQKSAHTHTLISKSGTFGLTILSAEQSQTSDLFAGKMVEIKDRFAGLKTQTLLTGSPLLAGGLAWLDCHVVQTFDAGLNTLFIAEVMAAQDIGDGQPLIYHNRKYWKLDLKT